jgi:hypothetical protein
MTKLNNTVLADMPTYVTHSANDPSFLVATSLLPGRTFSYWLLKTQINKNWHKDVFLYINLDSEVTQSRSSYLMFQWKSTLHHKLWALSYCYIRVSTQLRQLSSWCWTTAVKSITHTKETIILVGDQLDAQFLLWHVYLNPLHVSSNYVLVLTSE